jgi:hypothetical protein
MGGAAATAPEVNMDLAKIRCMCCGLTGMELATTTIVQQLAGVKVTVDGVPAMRCHACHGTSIDGKVMIPVDEAIEQILIATGVASQPTPDDDAALRAENRALARSLGQGDTFLDDPDEESVAESASEPSGAGSTAR